MKLQLVFERSWEGLLRPLQEKWLYRANSVLVNIHCIVIEATPPIRACECRRPPAGPIATYRGQLSGDKIPASTCFAESVLFFPRGCDGNAEHQRDERLSFKQFEQR